ncbi:DNA primase [Vagococcus coleopterorum]|uniref:DNA primase n=1 Tax=Vagococcus coleopterorum TaxID=2714946 RepID=A0A6G8APF6_9ENTE|nr:DNA primase [Vagococcus coleopterorum]QIL46886.1 DNA primase [Vagococcus coleopterorum]
MSQRIPHEVIEDIRNQANIVDVVGQYVQLKKSGKNHFGLCPFHDERSPSFSVAEDKQMYHCFGCGKGGNVFKFLQDLEGLTFPESVKKVADLGNMAIDLSFVGSQPAMETPEQKAKAALIELHESAADMYHHILLNTEVGAEALAYLNERGLTEEIIKEFQIGFAPAERILLQKIYERDEVPRERQIASGLMSERHDGELVDRFYQRIMFPIRDGRGQTVAFSGRILPNEKIDSSKQPKYLNSAETDIFNKREVLFNFDKAKGHARKEQELILFEGFMDVIAAWRAGVKHGVASMGTSLTNEQVRMIQKTTPQVLICYDGDSAGIEATHRALDLLGKQTNLELGVLSIPGGLDPDEYLKENGEEQFQTFFNTGRESVFTFMMRYHQRGKNLQTEQDRFTYIEQVVKELAKVNSVIEREVYIKQLSDEFDISVDAISAELAKAKTEERQEYQQQRQQQQYEPEMVEEPVYQQQPGTVREFQERPLTTGEHAEKLLLYRLMTERGVHGKINQIPDFAFNHDEYQELYQHFNDYMLTHSQFDASAFVDYLKEEPLKQKFVTVFYQEMSEESSEREISDYLIAIKQARLEGIKQEKIKEQREANRVGNKQLEQELTIEIINIQRNLKNLR